MQAAMAGGDPAAIMGSMMGVDPSTQDAVFFTFSPNAFGWQLGGPVLDISGNMSNFDHPITHAGVGGWAENASAGVVIGLIIPAGWYVTGVMGFDDFDPVRLESYTFIAPTGESLMYLMTFTGSTIDFGIAAVGGVILGSFLYAVVSRKFRVETFTDRGDMLRHIAGGIAMGFGGVLALGCTIGQGVTGMSTLALGSLLSLISIIAGSVVTMKIQYRNL